MSQACQIGPSSRTGTAAFPARGFLAGAAGLSAGAMLVGPAGRRAGRSGSGRACTASRFGGCT